MLARVIGLSGPTMNFFHVQARKPQLVHSCMHIHAHVHVHVSTCSFIHIEVLHARPLLASVLLNANSVHAVLFGMQVWSS